MSIFTKRHKNFSYEEDGGKTPVNFNKSKPRLDETQKKSKRKRIRRWIVLIISLLIVGSLLFFGYKAWEAVRNVFQNDGSILNLFTGQTQMLKGESEGRTNILLLGVGDEDHTASTLSDSIILASYDYRSKNLALFSIPRDLYVQIPGDGYAKINAAHAYGERDNYPGGGPELAKKVVEKNFGTNIHYFVRVDFSGLQKMVDALGGVSIDVENSFCDYNYPTSRKGDTRKVCFTKGVQNMNGTKALQYSRSRHALGVEGSDFARSRRQQKVILAIKEKALTANTVFNPKKVLDVLAVLGNHIKTDFQPKEFSRLYDLSKNVSQDRVISKSFDNGPEGMLVSSSSPSTGYILRPISGNFDKIKSVVKNIFDFVYVKEEKAPITLENGGYGAYSFNKIGTALEKEGYNIVSKNSKVQSYSSKSKIIDNSNGKYSKTIKALEEKLGVEATTGSDGTGGITVIIGRYYKG